MATFGSTIGSGGFRFYDKNHTISYNYVEGVYGGDFQGPLLLDSGDVEGLSPSLDAHWRVVNALVERNVLVGNPEGIRFGHNYSLAPTGCTVRDNVIAQAATGTAVTQRIAPVSTTQTNNVYFATPATGGLAQGNDTIWRKDGFGPRLTFLQPTEVGPNADLGDTDGTGVLVGGGGTTPPPVDDGTAASRFGWGVPLGQSDEFEYTGAPATTKWSAYTDASKRRTPARVTVSNGKMVLTGLAGGDTAGLAHKLDQQYGRWEVRCRSFYTNGAPSGGGSGPTQTLGVGGIATPPGAIVETGNRGAFTISTGGTAASPRVYDGNGFDSGRITISADNVVVQNYRVNADGQYGIFINNRNNVTIQNNDIRNIHAPGDLNAITAFGNNIKILFNTAINFVTGDPGGSHTDFIQTWVSSSHPIASANWEIRGNKATGPANPSRDNGVPSIHQWLMAEGYGRGGNSGGDGADPHDWLVADNEIGDSWNQAIKLDGIDNVNITRNKFVGSSDKVMEVTSASSNVKFYSDNQVGSGYGSVGVSITPGSGPGTPPVASTTGDYHPLLILWTDLVPWPTGGEIDFLENDAPGQQFAEAWWHYPHSSSVPVQQIHFTKPGVDLTQFHNFAIEWTPDGLVSYIDGEEWGRASGGAVAGTRENIQDLRAAHLTVQLDNFGDAAGSLSNQNPATFEVEWARVYSLTPSGGGAGDQTVTATGIPSAEAFGMPTVTGAVPAPPPGTVPTLLGVNSVLGTDTLGYTQGDVEEPPPGTQIVRAVGIPSAQAFGRPDVVRAAENVSPTVAAQGIVSAEAFGRPVVTLGPPAPPAPDGVLVPALYAVGPDGTTLIPLPAWTKISISPVRNSSGSITVDYPAGAPGFQLLHDSVSASPLRACEFRLWLGGNSTAAVGGWLVQKSGDALTLGSTWQFGGHFHEWLLTKALVYPQAISEANKSGAMIFAGATTGLIFTTMMAQAQARGALPLMTQDFTTTHDSNGQPWANAISSLKLAPKTTLFDVAGKLVELGMCEFEVTPGRIWRAYNPGGQGVDRTTGSNPLLFAHAVNLSEHARRESSRDAGTAVLVAGAEGFYDTASSATAQAQLGWRAEVAADAGQLNSATAVHAVAASYLEKAVAGTAEYNSAIEFGPGAPIPLIDYAVGDWAFTTTGNIRKKLRIAQIELEFSSQAPARGKVVQNDLITDKLTALYRRLNAISTGDAVVGTSESTPGGAGEDTIPPAAPTGLTVASIDAYQQPGESETYALVEAGWNPVTTNAYASTETSGAVKAAGLIADRIYFKQSIAEDWTWSGMPEIVKTYHQALLDEAKAASLDGEDNWMFSAATLAWLDDYPATHIGGGAITDDVAEYRVQWRFLGSQVVPSRQDPGNGVPGEPQPPRDPNAFPDDAAWFEPGESPTTTNRIEFGGVLAGRAINVRVSAVDRSGNQGPWCTPVGVVTAIDNRPPPAPSKPIATAWFRTMDITWDGKGSSGEDMFAAAPDVAGGGGVEVHVDTGIDFTPDRPIGANGKVDLAVSRTYKATLYDAGTWNVVDLEIGTTYYARFVAVDRSGNASDPSETSDGVLPERLVNIDIGPNAIAHEQIIDGEIVNAKIADLAVNSAKIEEVEVGKLRTGTMTASVAIAGRFSTPLSATGHQIEFDSGGLRMYRSGTVIGRWETFDGSMLVTGQMQTAITGQRIVENPGGGNPDTMRFYPTFSDVYSSITSVDFQGGTIAGIQVIGSGTTAIANRGMLIIRDQNASLVHGRTDLGYWGSEIWVEQNFTRNKSATVDLIIDERLTPLKGPRRVAMITYSSGGQPRNATGLYYGTTGAFGGEPMLYANGQDVNLVFGGTDGVTSSRLLVRNNANTQFREIAAGAFAVNSGRDAKYGIREFDGDPVRHLRSSAPKHFRRHGDLESDAERLGFIAEEMPDEVRRPIRRVPTEDGPEEVIETLDLGAISALLWAATRRIEERLSSVESTVERALPPRRRTEEPDA